jgi:hypothetical protein
MSCLFGKLVEFRFQEGAKNPQQRASTAYFGARRYFSGETISLCSQGRRYFPHIPELTPSSQFPSASSGEPQFFFLHMVHFSSIPKNVLTLFNVF